MSWAVNRCRCVLANDSFTASWVDAGGMPIATSDHMHDSTPRFDSIPFLNTDEITEPTLLTDDQREVLARIGKRLKLPARTTIYRESDRADSVSWSSKACSRVTGNYPVERDR